MDGGVKGGQVRYWVYRLLYLHAFVRLRAVSVLFIASGRATGWKKTKDNTVIICAF